MKGFAATLERLLPQSKESDKARGARPIGRLTKNGVKDAGRPPELADQSGSYICFAVVRGDLTDL